MNFRFGLVLFWAATVPWFSPAFAAEAVRRMCDAAAECPCADTMAQPSAVIQAPVMQNNTQSTMGSMNMGSMNQTMDMNHAATFIGEILHHASAGTSAEPNS